MKTAPLAAVLVALAALPAAAETEIRISSETRPLQPDNASLPPACRDQPVPVRIEGHAYAGDGDTITLIGLKHRVRIWGIQAAELRDKDKAETVPGMRARARLEDLLDQADHATVCQPTKWDRYCRYVAVCETAPNADKAAALDVGRRLLDDGLAYGFYLDDPVPGRPELSNAYARAEATARQAKRGLWPYWLGEKP